MKKIFLAGLLSLFLLGIFSLNGVAQDQVDMQVNMAENLAVRGGFSYISLSEVENEAPDNGIGFYLGPEYDFNEKATGILQFENIAASEAGVDINARGIGAQLAYDVYTVNEIDIAIRGGAGYYFSGNYDGENLEASPSLKAGTGVSLGAEGNMNLNLNCLYRSLEMDYEDKDDSLDLSGLEIGGSVSYFF
ncbi:MAG: outer membrane beta-barrel protein [Halanaerobiales bacterium]